MSEFEVIGAKQSFTVLRLDGNLCACSCDKAMIKTNERKFSIADATFTLDHARQHVI
jgi:hypothetical protein